MGSTSCQALEQLQSPASNPACLSWETCRSGGKITSGACLLGKTVVGEASLISGQPKVGGNG